MYEIYTLQDGDTISSVSEKFGTNEDVIYQINGLDSEYVIVPGMQLVVPKVKNDKYIYYTVKKGDSPYEIAKKYNVDVKILLYLNGLDEGDYIYPNQILLIPRDDFQFYMTQSSDTFKNLMERYHVSVDELIKDNEKVYLMPEQIIAFRKK